MSMSEPTFVTVDGVTVPAVTADEMREVDRIAIDELGFDLLQLMENAGRNLAWHVRDEATGPVVVVAGNGGNGGGGLACARHLVNRGVDVAVLLDRSPSNFDGAAAHQHAILAEMGVSTSSDPADITTESPAVVVDALIGYGLSGPVRGTAADLIGWMGSRPAPVVSLDVPSGRDATTGEIQGTAVEPARTVTLALPKPGLAAVGGTLYLADISIPPAVYERLGLAYEIPFDETYWVEIESV
jgi:NAD(P)H-hydrate epimerase